MQSLLKFRLLIVLLLPSFLFAQNAEEAKLKEQRRAALVEQILAEIPNLRLGENRAIVDVRVGNLLWDSDQKRARSLFQNAITELVNAQTQAEANQKATTYQNELLTGQTTRPQILNTIAARDAEFALQMLVKTRPAAIVKALAMVTEKGSKISNYSGNSNYLAQNEWNMEQSFVRMAADQSPERAVKLLKESLTKGFSGETPNLLKKLHEKDPTAADELTSEIVSKLVRNKFAVEGQPNYQNIQIAITFLTDFTREKNPSENTLKFDDSQMHSLADKLISYYLEQGNGPASYLSYSIIPIAEKLSPNSVEQLKKISRNASGRGEFSGYDPELQKLLTGDKTADQLLAEAKSYSANSRRQIYQTAANKYLQQGDFGRASDVLNENFSDDALEDAMRNLKMQWANNLIAQGKFAEAEAAIDEAPENTRNYAYINLANSVYQKDPKENKSYAMAVLAKARSLISDKPENSTELGILMQIISTFINIEPDEAFRLFDPLVPQINELSEASVVLAGFQGGSNVRDGEVVISQGNSYGFYMDYSILGQLSQKDFARAMNLIDGFTRRETRISLKLQVAERLN